MSDVLTQCSSQLGNCDELISSWLLLLIIPVTIFGVWWGIRADARDVKHNRYRYLYDDVTRSSQPAKERVPDPATVTERHAPIHRGAAS